MKQSSRVINVGFIQNSYYLCKESKETVKQHLHHHPTTTTTKGDISSEEDEDESSFRNVEISMFSLHIPYFFQVGRVSEDFTIIGIILAILFFPLGILCCLMMKEKKCDRCGAKF